MEEIRVVTQNIDWGLNDAHWEKIIDQCKSRADVILVQEAKWTELRNFRDADWAVFQVKKNDGTAGSGILWRRAKFVRTAQGIDPLVTNRGKAHMNPRWITWVDLRIKGDGRRIRFASLHYPPKRYSYLWGQANKGVTTFIKKARAEKIAFVIGGDFNEVVSTRMHGLATRLRVTATGKRIDGFLVARRLIVTSTRSLPDNASDHDAVQTKVRFRQPRFLKKKKK